MASIGKERLCPRSACLPDAGTHNAAGKWIKHVAKKSSKNLVLGQV